MSVQQFVKCLNRLSLTASVQGLAGLSATRCLQTSPCLLRKLDARAYPPSQLPSSRTNRWEPTKKMRDVYEYTVKPIPMERYGGRGPNGRIWNYRRAGGWKRDFLMVDWHRERVIPPDQEIIEERVLSIHNDINRSAKLAMIGNAEQKRYIVATESMQVGDIVRTCKSQGVITAKALEGDAFPLGSLPVGSVVNSVEKVEGQGGRIACAAGTVATIVRKVGDQVIVRMPSKREISVSSKCMATVGRVNFIENKEKFYKAGQKRWLGYKPRSGLWHRKTGRFGRKIRGIKPMLTYTKKPQENLNRERIILDGRQNCRFLHFHESVRGAQMR